MILELTIISETLSMFSSVNKVSRSTSSFNALLITKTLTKRKTNLISSSSKFSKTHHVKLTLSSLLVVLKAL